MPFLMEQHAYYRGLLWSFVSGNQSFTSSSFLPIFFMDMFMLEVSGMLLDPCLCMSIVWQICL